MPTPPDRHRGGIPAQDRRWRYCVLRTVRDLRLSVARRRTLSLPNLCRLFDLRWGKVRMGAGRSAQGRMLGRSFLEHYYLQRQPFRAPTTAGHLQEPDAHRAPGPEGRAP